VIYFTQDTQTKAIKIGYSKNPKRRRAGLQTATPNELALLGTVHGGLEHERAYHDKFAQFHIQGEWFKGEILPSVLEIIAKNPIEKPPPSNVIVVGDGEFNDERLVAMTLDELHARNPIAWLVTGGERTLEAWAWRWASRNNVDVYRYYPKWRTRGRFAAFDAQRRLLRSMFDPKTLVAFLAGRANSSALTLVRRAEKMGIEVVIKGQRTAAGAGNANQLAAPQLS
jgi:YspA, cpYpsA-related SLOG family/Meiotically up-regulated gene 113